MIFVTCFILEYSVIIFSILITLQFPRFIKVKDILDKYVKDWFATRCKGNILCLEAVW